MQLFQDIPALSGLRLPPGKSRNEQLQEDGRKAQREVKALLARARKRARTLAAVRALALWLAGLLVAVVAGALLATVAPSWLARTLTALLALLATAAVVRFSLRSPLQRAALQPFTDERGLARVLAGASDLLSSVELSGAEEVPGTSPELLALLSLRAAESVRKLDLRVALPSSLLNLPLSSLGFALALVAALTLLLPQKLAQGLLRLRGGDAAGPAAELSPIAGDLEITYLYPAYTSLPPRTEQGTAGDLHAPRGTEVRISARADRDLEQAVAVLNGASVKLLAQGPGKRLLSGSFTLTQPGQWSLRFLDLKSRAIAEGPPRPVEIIADQPPTVSIDEPTKRLIEVDPLGKVPLLWSATDDYGLGQVTLVLQQAGGKEERIVLQSPAAPAKRLRGAYSWELAPLKLRAGDKVSYYLEARDNDAVDGPQRGVSATQTIKVFSAAEHSREALVHAQALWERLVSLLGDRLEEPRPPAEPDGASWYNAASKQDAAAQRLSLEMNEAGRELSRDKLAPRAVGRALIYAASGLSRAVQGTSIARAPLARGVAGHEGSQKLFARALPNEIKEEEKDVLYLEDLLDRSRLDAMQELSKELAASRRELAHLAEKLRKAPDEGTKKELLSEVERLRERVQDLMQRMSEMAKGIRDEHLNQEAVEAVEKEQDLLSQLTDIQKKLQSGKIEEALKELDRLGAELEKLEKNLQNKASEAQGGQYSEEGKKLKEAAAQLRRIEEKEQDLQKRTAALRRETRAAAQKRFEQKGGKDLAKKLREKVEQAKKAVREIDPKVAEHLGLEDALEGAVGRVDDLQRALELGDFDEARELAERGLRAVEALQGRLTMEDQVAQRYPGFARDPAAVKKSLGAANAALPPMNEIAQKLAEALPKEEQNLSPEQMQRLKRQEGEQRDLKDQLGKVREELGEVAKKAPIFGPQHERMLQEAQSGMGEAEQKLGRFEPRGAQAGEEQALDKMQKFEQAMEELAKQSGGKPGGSGMPMPWGQPQGEEGDEEGDGHDPSKEKVQIPDAEASRAPAEFRKELLDAMKQAAPEKYKDRVKQYYEELVK